MTTDCVILAAGCSKRMGKNKLLLEINDKTVIECCINAFYESCTRIIVVTGNYHEDMKQCLTPYSKVKIVYNGDYQQGMYSSVKAGIKHIASDRFYLTPGDYPLLRADTITQMIRRAGNYIVPVYHGKRGHPILLDKLYIPIILDSKSVSLRDCLKSFSSEIQEVNVEDSGILTDMDTIQEYKQVLQML